MDEYGEDFYQYDPNYVDSTYFNCDLCLNLMIDTINIQKEYLQDFKEQYFGKEGKRSETQIAESLDSKWVGLSIDVVMEYCQDNEWDEDQTLVNVLGDDDIINEGKNQFLDLFNHYQEMCRDSKFKSSFDYDIY